jgi:hypothetical protein
MQRYEIVFYRNDILDELIPFKKMHKEFNSYQEARVWAQNELYDLPTAVAMNVFMDV